MNQLSSEKLIPKSKIVILWSAPRCVSTAFERTFAQRTDTFIWHEPFAGPYYYGPQRQSERMGNADDESVYYKEDGDPAKVIQNIYEKEAPLIFIKDMAYHFLPYLDKDFLRSVTNTFIVRDPQETIASWYKLEEKPTEAEFGFGAIHQIWEIVTQQIGHQPIVVNASDFRRHPCETLTSYCQAISVDFDPHMVDWKSDREQKYWKPNYQREIERKWFGSVDSSSRILPPAPIETPCLSEDKEIVERATKVYTEISKYAVV